MRNKKTVLCVVLAIAMILVVFAGCAKETVTEDSSTQEAGSDAQKAVSYADEEYVWVSALSSYPMFVANDHVGLEKFAAEYGVKVSIVGPTEYDVPGQAAAILELIPQKPAGIMVLGLGPELKGAIDKAVEAGIPVVTVDADVEGSNRLCYIGTDWYQVGVAHAEQVAMLIGEEGETAVVMEKGKSYAEAALRGYQDTIEKYPNIIFVGAFESGSDTTKSAATTADIISAYPDIKAISGMDGSSPGLGVAVKEADKVGKIVITAMNVDEPQLAYLKEGVFNALIGQKRQLFTYYGAKVLFDYNHSTASVCDNDKEAGIDAIPSRIDTGLFILNSENIDAFIGEE